VSALGVELGILTAALSLSLALVEDAPHDPQIGAGVGYFAAIH
jgi:hypothetical protein